MAYLISPTLKSWNLFIKCQEEKSIKIYSDWDFKAGAFKRWKECFELWNMWFVQLQRGALQLRARSAAQPLPAPPAPLQLHQPGTHYSTHPISRSFLYSPLWSVKHIPCLIPNHQEEHRGKASPQQIQPELKKKRVKHNPTDKGREDDATKDWRKQQRHSTTHPKMRIRMEEEDLRTTQHQIKMGLKTTNKKKDSRRSKPVFAQLFFL